MFVINMYKSQDELPAKSNVTFSGFLCKKKC